MQVGGFFVRDGRAGKAMQTINRVSDEIAAISGMRGFAALWVFVYHFWVLEVSAPVVVSFFGIRVDLTWCFTFGWLGVPIFFVLSGFLLAQPFVRQLDTPGSSNIRIRAYAIRRILRVFPAYYFQLIVLIGLAYFFQFGNYPHGLASWFAHLTMTFFCPPYFIDGLNGAWWTLPIEFSFYLLLPLIAILLKPQRWMLLMLFCFGVMLCYRYVIYSVYLGTDVLLYIRISLLPGTLDSFGLGMLSAYCVHHVGIKPGLEMRAANAATLAMGLGFCISMILMHQFWMFYWSGGWMSYAYTPLV
jgi:peptidoglycan/LPS O-acetylase OafA/YrhL